MTNSNETAPEADYNEILSKLEALLREHQGNPSVSASVETGDKAKSFHFSGHGVALDQASLVEVDGIPTLTEMVCLAPEMLSPQPDIASLLEQILDSALRDAGIDLKAEARKTLVQALESRLFGL